MGAPMAGHLLKAGHTAVRAHAQQGAGRRRRGRRHGLRQRQGGGRSKADIVIIMVPDTPHVEDVLFGEDGVAAGLTQGQDRRRHELDLADRRPRTSPRRSTSSAATTSTRRSPAARSAPRTPRCRSWSAASEAAFDKVKPLFELMGKNITLVGGNGDGQTCKVANQIIVALNIEAVGEALLFAAKAGADPAKVRQALMGGFAVVAHPRSAWRAHDQAHLRSGLPHRAAPEGPEPGAVPARARSASRCPTPPPRRSCSMPAPRMAARPGTTRRWCARWRSWPTSRSAKQTAAQRLDATRPRELLRRMFDAAIAAAQPALCMPPHLPTAAEGRALVVIGAGKASAAMARAVEDHWPGRARRAGRHALRLRRAVRAHRDRRGGAPGARCGRPGRGAAHARTWSQGLTADDLVLCLISGGGSALLPLPVDGPDARTTSRRSTARC